LEVWQPNRFLENLYGTGCVLLMWPLCQIQSARGVPKHFDRHAILFPAFTMLLAFFLGAAPAMDSCPARKVDALFQTIGATAPGAAILVTENGRVLYEQGYGLADVEKGVPLTPTTRVCIASVTKQFTAAAVLILSERGRINLDQPVQAYSLIPRRPC
jgi:CubicO group peptidase (beta-lactamase class C family)